MRLLTCSELLLLLLLFGVSNLAEAAGCGPDCVGQCFGGTCLVADSLDDDPLPGAALPGIPAVNLATPSLLDTRSTAPLLRGFHQPDASTWQPASQAEATLASPSLPLPTQLPQIIQAQATSNTWPAVSHAGVAGFSMKGFGGHSAEAMDTFSLPSQSTFSGLGSAPNFVSMRVQSLRDELKRAQAEEGKLTNLNVKLRDQVERWREVGARVAEREAQAVEMLEKVPAPEASETVKSNHTAPALIAVSNYVSGLATVRNRLTSQSFLQLGCVVLLMCSVVLAYLSQSMLAKAGVDYRDMVNHAAKPGGSLRYIAPALRSVGICQYKVEVSEIHLGSLLGGGDVQVSLQLGNADEMCTEVLRQVDGSFLRFQGSFVLDVRKYEEPLVLTVVDGRGKLAKLEIPTRDLIRLAQREHAEYYRAELSPEEALQSELQRTGSTRRPYAAMRVRDVTNSKEVYCQSYGAVS